MVARDRVEAGPQVGLLDSQTGGVGGRDGRDVVLRTIEQLLRTELGVGSDTVDGLDRVGDFGLVGSKLVGCR